MTPTEPEPVGGLPRLYLAPCLLLLLAEGSTHGYELQEQLSAMGLERADSGGMYRALRSMERQGLVSSHWEQSSTGPARRRYALTEDGVAWLDEWAGTLRDVHRLLGDYLDRHKRLESPCFEPRR